MSAEINICNGGINCTRPGNLVQQFLVRCVGNKPFVFRYYLCPWHLGGWNRTRSRYQKKLYRITYKPDSEILEQGKLQSAGLGIGR